MRAGISKGFSPLTGIPWFPTAYQLAKYDRTQDRFQSPDGDSVVSHLQAISGRKVRTPERFQSPDGDSVVSHGLAQIGYLIYAQLKFQSPDGDSVVSHYEGIRCWVVRCDLFQSPDGDSVVSHFQTDEVVYFTV